MSSMRGWTTWDPSSIAVWEHLPSGLRCRLVLQDEAGKQLVPDSWAPLEDFLPDDAGHSLAHLLVNAGGAQVEVECGGEGDVAACHILEVQGEQVKAHWEVDGSRDGWLVVVDEKEVAVAPDGTPIPADINAFLRDQHDAARLSLPTGEGLLADTLETMETDLAVNTFLLPETDELITLSRHEMEATGEWSMPNWETFLTALGIAYADPALALANCRAALKLLAAENLLGARASASGPRGDISNPPVASYCIWKIFQLTGDEELLREAMPLLLRWHNWWREARDPDANDLLSWASAEESGMPGHPLYEEATLDETGVLMLNDVALNSLWALDAAALMRMALHFDNMELATHLESEVQAIADRMNLVLWDQNRGIFQTLDLDMRPSDRQSATALLALIAGIPSGIRAQRLVNEHLAQEFAAPYLVPTLGDGDAAFGEQQPWRGRVSVLMNYLICEGLRHYGEDSWAERIALSGLTLLRHGWNAEHHIYGSFNAQTGRGDDIAQDPMAPAGVLLGALGIGLLIDLEPWDGLRLGNLSGAEMALHGIVLQGDRYDLSSGPWGFSARRNGKPWIEADRPVILRNIVTGESEISLHAKVAGGGPLTLRFFGFAPGKQISVKVNGRLNTATVSPIGELECTVELPPAPDIGGQGMSRVA